MVEFKASAAKSGKKSAGSNLDGFLWLSERQNKMLTAASVCVCRDIDTTWNIQHYGGLSWGKVIWGYRHKSSEYKHNHHQHGGLSWGRVTFTHKLIFRSRTRCWPTQQRGQGGRCRNWCRSVLRSWNEYFCLERWGMRMVVWREGKCW